MLPLLREYANGEEHPLREVRTRLGGSMRLSQEELGTLLPSGKQTIFASRVSWAAAYLAKALVLERTTRGVYRITRRGSQLLTQGLQELNVATLQQYPEFVAFLDRDENAEPFTSETTPSTPEEAIETSIAELRRALASDLLALIQRSSPAFFERLVLELLVAMGYGGNFQDAAQGVSAGPDGGIDGRINEDKLGLDVIYVQAKRWKESVGRPVIQAFAGSLEGHRARKGVFLTTSTFSRDAREYVSAIEKRIVLIDGERLAELMMDHGVGVSTVVTYEIKKIDQDFFED